MYGPQSLKYSLWYFQKTKQNKNWHAIEPCYLKCSFYTSSIWLCIKNVGPLAPPQPFRVISFMLTHFQGDSMHMKIRGALMRLLPEIESVFLLVLWQTDLSVSLPPILQHGIHFFKTCIYLSVSDKKFQTLFFYYQPLRASAERGTTGIIVLGLLVTERFYNIYVPDSDSKYCSPLIDPAHVLGKFILLSSRIKVQLLLGPPIPELTHTQSVQLSSQYTIVGNSKPEFTQVHPSQLLISQWKVRPTLLDFGM